MTSWANRYRCGSNKNKSPSVTDCDKELVDQVRICQILYELYLKLTTFKGMIYMLHYNMDENCMMLVYNGYSVVVKHNQA